MNMTNTTELTQKKCQPCEGMETPLPKKEAQNYLQKISNWNIDSNGKMIYRDYVMKNFLAAIDLINKIAQIAESENHHPEIHLTSYRKLKIELTTHAIGGLSENDFIVAAKINELPALLKKEETQRV